MNDLSAKDLASIQSKLGISELSNDLAGLRRLYRSWCLGVPFDNLLKNRFMFRNPGAQPPFLDADEFFLNWLESGTGGTCWPHANALYVLAKSCGFDARRATAAMFDVGRPVHGTVIVRLGDGSHWILDNALQTLEPLRIDSDSPSLIEDPVHFSEVEPDPEGVIVHGTNPPIPGIFFRVLEEDVPGSRYRENWEQFALSGPFNSGVHIRRTEEDRITTLRGSKLFELTADGLTETELSRSEIVTLLHDRMRISPATIEDWAESGALDASMKPPSEMPPLPVRIPPSKR